MKTMILAAFAVAGLTAAMAPAAHAFTRGFPHPNYHSGPYDNTANSEKAPNISSSDAPGGQ
jgi:hypothetical protein